MLGNWECQARAGSRPFASAGFVCRNERDKHEHRWRLRLQGGRKEGRQTDGCKKTDERRRDKARGRGDKEGKKQTDRVEGWCLRAAIFKSRRRRRNGDSRGRPGSVLRHPLRARERQRETERRRERERGRRPTPTKPS